ncbi:MAG: efflux RND transporter periplasmic adaptor subunit [Pseudomonadota bacterium]
MRMVFLSLTILSGLSVQAPAETLEFEGRIEAVNRALVYSRAEGRVDGIYVTAGDRVAKGALLARIEPDLAELAVAAAKAELDRQEALLVRAKDKLQRAERLSQSGASSTVALQDARTEQQLAQAEHRAARVALDRARIELEDTNIRAPLSGIVEAPQIGLGVLLEFDAGAPPLFEIVQLDPVRVVYEVPYAERLAQLARNGALSTEALLQRVRLDLVLPGGPVLAEDITPQATSVRLNSDNGTVLVWAEVPNPDGTLRPGMRLTVHSEITQQNQQGGTQ